MRELNYTGALLGILCGAIYGGALGSAFDQPKIGVLVGIAAGGLIGSTLD